LPDFSWYNIPKRVKIYQKRGKIYPKRGKIYQLAINYNNWPGKLPNGRKMYQHVPLQETPKFTQIGIFCFENVPSGSPAQGKDATFCQRFILAVEQKLTPSWFHLAAVCVVVAVTVANLSRFAGGSLQIF
jgi:hypothetical protein